ncbi:MAG TPA: TatD family hydrolase [Acidimicrobiia bacterium]|nr:TatD family hydrolase [Acidimicrobiia bacterium]
MGWVDTHCHLQLDGRPPEELLGRAGDVEWLVVPGVDVESSRAAIDLAARYPDRIVATAGLHPHDAASWGAQADHIADMSTQVVAIGETGLDFYRNLASRPSQLTAFTAQLQLASSVAKPVVVHCRDAFAEVYESLERWGAGRQVVLHCWTGGPRWTRRFLDLGCWFSFAGPVAFSTGDTVRRGAELVPVEKALVETDTPYLAPPPHRHEPNEPAWVALVGEALARVWSLPTERVREQTATNARAVFDPAGVMA